MQVPYRSSCSDQLIIASNCRIEQRRQPCRASQLRAPQRPAPPFLSLCPPCIGEPFHRVAECNGIGCSRPAVQALLAGGAAALAAGASPQLHPRRPRQATWMWTCASLGPASWASAPPWSCCGRMSTSKWRLWTARCRAAAQPAQVRVFCCMVSVVSLVVLSSCRHALPPTDRAAVQLIQASLPLGSGCRAGVPVAGAPRRGQPRLCPGGRKQGDVGRAAGARCARAVQAGGGVAGEALLGRQGQCSNNRPTLSQQQAQLSIC